jgi:hypothetical protein
MAPYERKPKAAPLGSLEVYSGGSLKKPRVTTANSAKQELLNELARVRQHLEQRVEANAIIADIRDRLRERIRTHEFWMPVDDLQADVAHFTRLCRCLARRGR